MQYRICYLLITCSLILNGCSYFENKKLDMINLANGVNRYEAVDMAVNELENAPYNRYFQALEPKLREDKHALKYPDYWFVDFTVDVNMDFTGYLVVIHKETGEILRSRMYYWPEKVAALDWVFQDKGKKSQGTR